MKRYRPHILVVIALAIVLSTGWHGSLRNALTDLRFAWQSRDASGKIVVVAIDAPSIDQIGVWPWPRRLHAELLRRLEAAGAQDIAFDVDFSTPSDSASDEAFARALREVGGSTILPSFKQPTQNGGPAHVNRPLKSFSNQSWPAVVNVAVETDGLVRRYPFDEKIGDGRKALAAGCICQTGMNCASPVGVMEIGRSDIFVAASADHDIAGIGHALGHLDDRTLCLEHLGHRHRAAIGDLVGDRRDGLELGPALLEQLLVLLGLAPVLPLLELVALGLGGLDGPPAAGDGPPARHRRRIVVLLLDVGLGLLDPQNIFQPRSVLVIALLLCAHTTRHTTHDTTRHARG